MRPYGSRTLCIYTLEYVLQGISSIKPTIKKIAVCSIIVVLLVYSIQFVTDESVWNWVRGILLFIAGLVLLFQITKLIWLSIERWTYRKILRFFTLTLWSPIFLLALIMLLYTSTCEYRGRGVAISSEAKIRNTRVYIDYVGDAGAVGDAGQAVFQEKPLVGSFYKVKAICWVPEWKHITYSIIDDQSIECNEDGNVRTVKLPF